jgi:hypothetical protein
MKLLKEVAHLREKFSLTSGSELKSAASKFSPYTQKDRRRTEH